ncbi:hypothetical protein [Anaerosporobacter sp.]
MKWLKEAKHKEMNCNVCGKKLKFDHGILKEDVFTAKKEWGYFSDMDLQVHSFNVCEDCYNKMVSTFVIPVDISVKGEVI